MYTALIDCNNFYVACERVFNPKLLNKPIVILSNNDGCVISRSNEAKTLGIPMGAPFFQYRELFRKEKVAILSSNYALYGDMSNRVMSLIEEASSEVDLYSIDEAFLRWDAFEMEQKAIKLRKQILDYVGIPVSIGLGRTKTLAKAAATKAKKEKEGIFLLREDQEISFLDAFSTKDIWGVGRALHVRLAEENIHTALELRQAADLFIQKKFSVVLLRVAFELRGIPCFFNDEAPSHKKSITSSRSFGRSVSCLNEICEAVSTYAARAGEKLRAENAFASFMLVFLVHHPFRNGVSSLKIIFKEPVSATPHLISAAKDGACHLFMKGQNYRKAGVILGGITEAAYRQGDLFFKEGLKRSEKLERAQEVIDSLNHNLNKKAVIFAAEGLKKPWAMKQEMRTPRWTTRWNEILKIKI